MSFEVFLGVALIVAFVVWLVKKTAGNNRSTDYTPIPSGEIFPEIPADGSAQEAKTVQPMIQGPPQNTIYAHYHRQPVKICRACDGENPISSNRCRICGALLK